jgi:murein DD-endopeptidase MepM/ murein hydrolase activator NlpD
MTMRGWLLIAVLALSVAVVALAVSRLDGDPPEIALPEQMVLGTNPVPLVVDLSDEGSGLRRLDVRIEAQGVERDLVSESFQGSWLAGGAPGSHQRHVELDLDPARLGLGDGDAEVVVVARDWSWRDGFRGNPSEARIALRIDTSPPRVQVESGLTYAERGGAGVIVYRVDEQTARDGVRVGDAFFRGYPVASAGGEGGGPEASTRRAAIFAVPVEAGARPEVRVLAEDLAGNATERGVNVRIRDREFARGDVGLPDDFLERVAVPLAEANGLASDDPVEAFRQVNRALRAQNEARIREIVSSSSPVRQFSGAFEQWRNSAVRSRFAEFRDYKVGGVAVSDARHYGFDLASTARAPVTASNAGTVAFAGDLGIYGQCVVIDHGIGVHSLYGHLSDIAVAEGERVEKGAVLGHSGETGLAGGDHLHFAILVGGEYANPVEWWDPRWVKTHIDARLGEGPAMPDRSSEGPAMPDRSSEGPATPDRSSEGPDGS